MPGSLALALAILSEIVATSALKASAGFSRLLPAMLAVLGYAAAFYCLSLALRTIPLGVAYAIWSAVGIVVLAAIGWIVFGQRLSPPTLIGMGLIVVGVLLVWTSAPQA